MRLIEHHDYLMRLTTAGGRMVVLAADLIAAASLRRLGYAMAEDSHDGIELYMTEAATKYVEKYERSSVR